MRFVAIDFEATCDEPYNPSPQEIIEFPAVVAAPGDPFDGAEFHTFVRPVAHPRLTRFCTELTGIEQNAIDAAPTFPEVLTHFEAWWQTYADGALCVTCGDWDLKSLLPRQCSQHALPVPDWATRWANLKSVYARTVPGATDHVRLSEMASQIGVPMVGRLHSGIDDARNIGRILRKLLDLGASVTNSANAAPRVDLKPGDWLCPQCGEHNFARRDVCFGCRRKR